MTKFLEIKSLGKEVEAKILKEIEERKARKIKAGTLTEKEIREIEEMKLQPLPDILDVQSVYEDSLYKKKKF